MCERGSALGPQICCNVLYVGIFLAACARRFSSLLFSQRFMKMIDLAIKSPSSGDWHYQFLALEDMTFRPKSPRMAHVRTVLYCFVARLVGHTLYRIYMIEKRAIRIFVVVLPRSIFLQCCCCCCYFCCCQRWCALLIPSIYCKISREKRAS